MKCVSINELKFDKESLAAIKDIRRRSNLSILLSRIMPTGTITNIFLGNGLLKSSYNISQADFEALAQAMQSLPVILRRVISNIAREQQLYHSGNEREFWVGVENGCGVQ
ncbi:MAG: hypothetical protein COB33_014885 [Thiotrichaceae bacterium]|nr:hypothetical protein [Thiotrichaceae bacterium]PCI12952.1 MAG: hypothetical protein COB71_07540 [Thiotrichales bacterium]